MFLWTNQSFLRRGRPRRRKLEESFFRINRLPPYVFTEVQALKLEARRRGEDIIDFGMGNPDGPTPPHIVEKLIEAARNPRNRSEERRVGKECRSRWSPYH